MKNYDIKNHRNDSNHKKEEKKDPSITTNDDGDHAVVQEQEGLLTVLRYDKNEEIARLCEENRKLKEALDVVNKQMGDMRHYYFHLVWRARCTTEEVRQRHPGYYTKLRRDLGAKHFAQFKRDERKLSDPLSGDWQHGFNSGVLATTRLVMGLTEVDDEHMCCGYHDLNEDGLQVEECGQDCYSTVQQQRRQAMEEFPMLDT